jgi:hypothetical protein
MRWAVIQKKMPLRPQLGADTYNQANSYLYRLFAAINETPTESAVSCCSIGTKYWNSAQEA